MNGERALQRLLLALGLLLAVAGRSVGDEKANQGFFLDHDREFEADADANVYAGPAPLAVRFSARAIHASGRVTYRWNFDDGTTSIEQNPAHTFGRQGWYSVTMDARDAAGRTYRMNLLLHAWRPKDWARLQAHEDVRIMRRSLRELERKRTRDAAPSAPASDGAAPANPDRARTPASASP